MIPRQSLGFSSTCHPGVLTSPPPYCQLPEGSESSLGAGGTKVSCMIRRALALPLDTLEQTFRCCQSRGVKKRTSHVSSAWKGIVLRPGESGPLLWTPYFGGHWGISPPRQAQEVRIFWAKGDASQNPARLLDHVPGADKRGVPSQVTLHPHPGPVCFCPGDWIAAVHTPWPREQRSGGRGGVGVDRTWMGGLGTCEGPLGSGGSCTGSKGDRLQAGGRQEKQGGGGHPRNGSS